MATSPPDPPSAADKPGADPPEPRHAIGWLSVGNKLAGSTVVLILVATVGAYLALSRTQRENLLRAKERAASAVTQLFVDSCTPGVVFGDDGAISDELATLGRNPEVVFAAVWGRERDGRLRRIGELRRPGVADQPIGGVPAALELTRERDRLVIRAPLVDRGGVPIGVTVVAYSLAQENASLANIERTTLAVSTAVALGLLVLLLVLARVTVVGPLGQLVVAAQDLERGGTGEVRIDTADEVGRLAQAFSSMAAAIRVREGRINARNRDMRLVLDNVGQGFVTLDLDGKMSEERSRVIDAWFGPVPPGVTFGEYLGSFDADLGEWFNLAWSALQEDVLPLELCLDQLPKAVRRDEGTFELTYRPVMDGPRLAQVIVVVTDVTESIAREQAEQAQRETLAVFRRLLADRAALDDFFAETSQLVREITGHASRRLDLVKRQIHTVKGNTALFGLDSVAAVCQQIEDHLAEMGPSAELGQADRRALGAAWGRALAIRAQLSEAGSVRKVELDRAEYDSFLADLRSRLPHDLLLETAVTWVHEPAAKRLAILAEQIKALAGRLGRAPVDVTCGPTALRLPPHKWSPFWSAFAHAIRNTADHGVQTAAERAAAGKPPRASVTLEIAHVDREVVISIADDGPGIAWPIIARKARARGLPASTQADLVAALFCDGVSVRDAASDVSGRGVGLAALRELVARLGGRITVDSTAGQGTRFDFFLPETMLSGDGAARHAGASLESAAGVPGEDPAARELPAR